MDRQPGKYERLARERHERDLALAAQPGGHPRGLRFDQDAADRVITFIEVFCRHYEGEWAGDLVSLEEWQKRDIIGPIFGWMNADGTRRYRTAYIELPRKNGKSLVCSTLAVYLTVGDNEPGAQVYSSATKEEQAAIVWRGGAEMIRRSPDLQPFLLVHGARKKTGGSIFCEELGSFFRPLGADSTTQDGLNPHGNIIDELHAHKDDGVWNVLDTAMGARRQPLIIAITTAGTFDPTAIGWQKHEYATQVLEGSFEDDTFFAYIAAIDDGDDPFSEDSWKKANPNYGVSVKPSDMARLAKRAQLEPSFYNKFLQLRLNRWTQQAKRWIQPERWAECDPISAAEALAQRGPREKALEGRECCAGLDLASTQDLNALVLDFLDPDGVAHLICRFWLPEARVEAESKAKRRHYQQWVDAGWIVATPGEVTDYEFIRTEIRKLSKLYRILRLSFDPWNAGSLPVELREKDGINAVEFRQTMGNFAGPSKEFEKKVISRKFRHGGNPVLAWNVGNLVIKTDASGNIRPDRQNAKGKVDGAIATIEADAGATLEKASGSGSPYSATRGLLSL